MLDGDVLPSLQAFGFVNFSKATFALLTNELVFVLQVSPFSRKIFMDIF